jgi:pimeloyl-ACP methyl ester carboxylesterase
LILHHERVAAGAPTRWILFLPGIYGSGRNWASVARRLVRARPEWAASLVDLRQHGASQGFPPPHTIEAAAADVAELVTHERSEAQAVLGHSFGGKVALIYARSAGAGLEQLWVVDSSPEARPPGGSAWDMLRAVRAVPTTFTDRSDGVRALEGAGVATPVAQWMALNLESSPAGGWRWRIDLDDMEAMLRSFFETDAWDVIEQPPPGLVIHVLKAEESSVLSESACDRIEAAGKHTGRVFLHRVAGGHWVNADNPDALQELLVANL